MHRQRTSQACVPCGQRKTRCDGSIPACSQCLSNGRECFYGVSKRNKRQKLSEVQQLAHNVQQSPGQSSNVVGPMLPSAENEDTGDDPQLPDRSAPITTRGPSIPSETRIHVTASESSRLFKAYFECIHPIWPILYKPLYDCSEYHVLSTALPQSVLYAIYAIAACIKPDTEDASSSEQFYTEPSLFYEAALLSMQRSSQRSKTSATQSYRPLQLIGPSVENCLTLTLLALQQHGYAEAANSSMLCGMACAIAIELGLHKANRTDEDSTSLQVASRLWWNLFVLDKMIACELTKPCILRSEDCDTPFPSTSESDEYQLLQFQSPDTNSMSTAKALTLSGFHATIRVTKLMEKVARQVYSAESRRIVKSDPSAAELTRMALWQGLKDYYASINGSSDEGDAVLLRERAVPPSLVTNSVWTWTTVILLHYPFTFPGYKKSESVDITSASDSDLFEVIFVAAEKICQIIERHTKSLQRFPCDLIFPIFTAAKTLCNYQYVESNPREETLVKNRLDMCNKWLSIICRNWKYAGKSKSKLTQDLYVASSHVSLLPTGTRPVQFGSSSASSAVHTNAQCISHTPTEDLVLHADSVETINQSDHMISHTDWESPAAWSRPDIGFAALDAEFRDFLDNGLIFDKFSSV